VGGLSWMLRRAASLVGWSCFFFFFFYLLIFSFYSVASIAPKSVIVQCGFGLVVGGDDGNERLGNLGLGTAVG
jgi:hypothetical protein